MAQPNPLFPNLGEWDTTIQELEKKDRSRRTAENEYGPPAATATDAGGSALGYNQFEGMTPANPPPAQQQAAPRQQVPSPLGMALDQRTEFGVPGSMVVDALTRPVWVPGTPGRPGYGPQDAEKRFKTKESESLQLQGPNLTDEEKQAILDQRMEGVVDQKLAQDKRNQIAELQAGTEYQASQARLEFLRKQVEQKTAEQKALELEYNSKEAEARAEVAAAGKEELDPMRFVTSKSAGAQLLMLASVAFAGYANGMAGKGANGMGIVGDFIQADIESQRERIANRRKNSDNALARMSAKFGSVEAGKKALEAMQWELAGQQIQTMMDSIGTEKARMAGEAALADISAKSNELWAQTKIAFAGERTAQMNERYRDPIAAVAGTRGYSRPPTLEESLARMEKVQGLYQGGANIAKTNAEVQKALAEANGDPGAVDPNTKARLMAQLGQELGKVSDVETALSVYMEDSGMTFDKNGRVVAPNGVTGKADGILGYALAGTPTLTEATKKAEESGNYAAQEFITKLTGAASNAKQDATLGKRLQGHGTASSNIAGVQALADQVRNYRASLLAGYGPLAREFEENLAKEKGFLARQKGSAPKRTANPFDSEE